MSNVQQPYSVHSFMLPFRWDYLPADHNLNEPKEKQSSFEDRTNLKSFLGCLLCGSSKWKRKFFRIESKPENFNEVHYFHAFAARTLFDLQQFTEKIEHEISDDKAMVYFELPTNPDKDSYTITILEKGNSTPYYKTTKSFKLFLSGIGLHVYNTGVAILTINLDNQNYPNQTDILEINEYGRRLYPQFLHSGTLPLQKVKETFLADSITISIEGFGDFTDNFDEYNKLNEREVHKYDRSEFKRSWVVRVPMFITRLFGEKFSFIQKDELPDSIRLNILTDDRMFFQCWYGENSLAEQLKIQDKTKQFNKKCPSGEIVVDKTEVEYPYLKDNFWYAYMFGDKKSPSIANQKMQEQLTEKHTYARWAGHGTLFGFSRDSFVSISSDVTTLITNDAPNIMVQMKTMYYQMAVLCLAQRVSVLRFSAEISSLADTTKASKDKKLATNIKVLYRNYIEFINKINYKEITPYVQGLEMYCHFRDVLEVQDAVKSLDAELNEMFNYIKLEADAKQGDEAHRLTLVATYFLPASFIASLFGIGFVREYTTLSGTVDWDLWKVWLIIIFGGAIISIAIININKITDKIKKVFKYVFNQHQS